METVLIKALQLIVALSLLIVLHEGGHFLFAKFFKTRVEKFYLFFDYKFCLFSTYSKWFRKLMGKQPVPHRKDKDGKELDEYEYEGTEYGIGWIPLGGYVKISGMIDESMDKEQMAQPPKPWEFRTKPAWQRLLIMLGGIIMNFITAFVIYSPNSTSIWILCSPISTSIWLMAPCRWKKRMPLLLADFFFCVRTQMAH